MNTFLKDLGEALAWIWMTPDGACLLLDGRREGAYAVVDISLATQPARIAA